MCVSGCVCVCLCLCVVTHYPFAVSSFLNITQSCSIKKFNILKFPLALTFECPSFSMLSRKGGKRELNKHPYLGLVFRAVQYIPAGRVEEEGCLLCFLSITGCPDNSEAIHLWESGTFSPSTHTDWVQKKMRAPTDAASMPSKWDEVICEQSHKTAEFANSFTRASCATYTAETERPLQVISINSLKLLTSL